MATALSMNGKKKIETLQKEFSSKFPFLTLIFLDEKRDYLEGSKTLSEIRKSKGDDISIVASLKVNSIENKFLKNYGLIVEVAYQKDEKVVITNQTEERTLNELNSWCQANNCNKFVYQKSVQNDTIIENNNVRKNDEVINEEDKITYNVVQLNEIKNFIKILRQNSSSAKNVFTEIYTQDYLSQDTIERCDLNGKIIKLKRTNWWEDSSWESSHTIEYAIEILLCLYKYGTNEPLDDYDIQWRFSNSGHNDNGCDIELIESEINDEDDLPQEILNEAGAIDVWELRNYCGYVEEETEKVDFEDITYKHIIFKFEKFELKIDPSEINDLTVSENRVEDTEVIKSNIKEEKEIVSDYSKIQIGTQIWMDVNLNVSTFSNGDPIFEAKSPDEWVKANKAQTPAFCHYKFDKNNATVYSKYYNWYAINDKRGLAPKGWSIPSIDQFDQLFSTLDINVKYSSGEDFSCWDGLISPALKSVKNWEYEEPANGELDACGTNTSGFNLLGVGYVGSLGNFDLYMEQTYLWASNPTMSNEYKSVIIDMSYTGILLEMKPDINKGCQIRCIKLG